MIRMRRRRATRRLTEAYTKGIFPWYSERQPVLWWSPDPRAVFDLSVRAPRSVRQSIARAGWRFSVDRDFAGVMRACAAWPTGASTVVPSALTSNPVRSPGSSALTARSSRVTVS